MKCHCGGRGRVSETRECPDGAMRRARRCEVCSARWFTVEVRVAKGRRRRGFHIMVLSDADFGRLKRGIAILRAATGDSDPDDLDDPDETEKQAP